MKVLLCVSLMLVVSAALAAKPLTAIDMHSLNKVQMPTISADKQYAVYAVKHWNSTSGKATTHLEAVNIKTQAVSILTSPAEGQADFNPVFSDDYPSILLFLSTRSGSSQIWKLNITSANFAKGTFGTPIQVSNYEVDISNLKFVKSALSFSAEVYIDCNENFKCTADKDAEVAKRGSNTWAVYDSLFVRHWDRWISEKVSHVFLHSVNSQVELTGSVFDLMTGMKTNSPVPPDGGAEQFDLHPTGNEVVFTGHDRTRNESWSTSWKVYRTVKGGKAEHITTYISARTQQPKYSPDGTKFAYLAMDRVGLESDKLHLELFDLSTRKSINLSGFWDRAIIDFTWATNTTILLIATDFGVNKVYSIDINNPKGLSLVLGDLASTVAILKVTSDDFVFQRSSILSPDDLFLFKLSTGKLSQLTNANPSLANFSSSLPESFQFKGGYGDSVQGWIMKPINYVAGKKYPVAFLIHGGPEGAWESLWSYRWNPQLWAARGYAVIMINPHGSTGQGQNYTDAVRNDWGGVPYFDLMTGLDYALSAYSYLDGNRACAVGASYGGYMVNWIQGQTDRFKCLITHDGVFSTLTMFYATEELWFPMAEYCPLNAVGCTPFDSKYRDRYIKYSPESYVANWKTPHLIIHGSNDFRIPISEGISAFTALQVKGIPSRFIHFTQENHWVLKPENSIKWYDEVLGWLDKYTNNTAPTMTEELKFLEETN